MTYLIDVFLHLDVYLNVVIQQYGAWTYLLLFVVVFLETGVVVTPFLPGDSLLFATGALAATGALGAPAAFALLATAAFTGNAVNYTVGRLVGPRVFSATDHRRISHRLLNRDHLIRAHGFFEQYGGKAVSLGRFVPIVRTFAPFVAGVGKMTYSRFITFNIIGGILWVTIFVVLGSLFGNIPFVKNNFEIVTLGIVFISILPMIFEYIRSRRNPKPPAVQGEIGDAT